MASYLELVQDIDAHARRGGGGERHDVDVGEALAQDVEPLVVGPEVVAPLRHAVRFVYHEPDGGNLY